MCGDQQEMADAVHSHEHSITVVLSCKEERKKNAKKKKECRLVCVGGMSVACDGVLAASRRHGMWRWMAVASERDERRVQHGLHVVMGRQGVWSE